MTIPSANEIRQQFIDYFVDKCGHTFVPSSPCVPHDDPTLMFANAGMNQFKPIFLGQQAPDVDKWSGVIPGMSTRAANSQKCIRAGGKHNDLDDVGHDTYHHTFFEMLGNWSFGDYFKKEAIEWAWDLLTNVWGIDGSRLHATYFEGDSAEGLEPDTEARDLWLKILPPDRVHPGNKKDNFWEMGDTGPCGPCSEIHIDLTPKKNGRELVNAGDPRVIEIWNLVFIQFNRGPDGKLSLLPSKHVDTGMGFERVTAILQGMTSNYDTDVFTPVFAAIREVTGAPDYTRLLEDDRSNGKDAIMRDVAYRVVADHVRCLTFALTDGAVPSNEGRGYVLRRILRRAVRYGRQYLGTTEPFLHRLVSTVVETMGEAFPELKESPTRVAEIILDEEASFGKTLDRGIALFEEAADYAVKHHHGRIGGEDAFKLHDTYGFPIDLTELMAQERGLSVNIGEYERLMEEARERARASKQHAITSMIEEAILGDELSTDFTGDNELELECTRVSKVMNILGGDNIKNQQRGYIVLDETPFYAESGGQVGDCGSIKDTGENWHFEVETTKRIGKAIVHEGICTKGTIQGSRSGAGIGARHEGDTLPRATSPIRVEASAKVNKVTRRLAMKNHTSTHVLNWALRDVLGDHVQQKGSLVDSDKTRFDLSHPSQITEEELARIEELVNRQIKDDLEVHTEVVDQAEARKINTLRAVFGEKYPDQVRVVSIGVPVKELLGNPINPDWMKYSVEFCGGTHLKRTGEAGKFRLVEESAVAKGIRRVVGVTGERAERAEADARAVVRLLKIAANADDTALPQRIAEITAVMNQAELPIVEKSRLRSDLTHLQERAKKAAKQAAKAGAADIMGKVDELLQTAEKVRDYSLVSANLGRATVDQLRAAADSIRDRVGSAAVFLASETNGKVSLLAAVTKDVASKGIKAGDVVKAIAPVVGGRGGGRPDMAQGGGTDVEHIDKAVREAAEWLRAKLGE